MVVDQYTALVEVVVVASMMEMTIRHHHIHLDERRPSQRRIVAAITMSSGDPVRDLII